MSALQTVTASRFTLERTPFGKLVLTNAAGERFEGVVPVRAFPIQSPGRWHFAGEHRWQGSGLDGRAHRCATARAGPDSGGADHARVYAGDCAHCVGHQLLDTLHLDGGYGPWRRRSLCCAAMRTFAASAKSNGLLIADAHGIQYLVRDQFALDAHSRHILDRFM